MLNKTVVKNLILSCRREDEFHFLKVLTLQLALTTVFFHKNIKVSG